MVAEEATQRGDPALTEGKERAGRAGTAMSWARMVAVAQAWKVGARTPVARVSLNAIAASTSQAASAANLPEGGWASGPFIRSALTCSMTAC